MSETLKVCKHNMPDPCNYCELQKQITALTDMYKQLSIEVAGIQDRNLHMIDGFEKLKESEEWCVDRIQGLFRWRNDRNDKINNMMEFETSLLVKIDSLNGSIDKLEDKIDSHKQKNPHKCPVCEGTKKIQFKLPAGGYWDNQCEICKGEGIVWG